MPDSEKTAMLLDELAALELAQRHEVATELRPAGEASAVLLAEGGYCRADGQLG